jgi:5-methylcytosine-specific restriction protein A
MGDIRYRLGRQCHSWDRCGGVEIMQFTAKTRQAISERAKGRCELCGTPVGMDAQIHHRKPRGMGGTKDNASRLASNGLFVHFRCHERIERNRDEALGYGWLVRQSGESAQEPVLLHYGWVLLNPDGSVDLLASLQGEKYQSPQQRSDDPEDSTHPIAERNDG